jgi:cell division protein FtsZ
MEPTAFRSPDRPASGLIAPGVSGSTNGTRSSTPAPVSAAAPSTPAPAYPNGSGYAAASGYRNGNDSYGNGNDSYRNGHDTTDANQAGTLPPASPSPASPSPGRHSVAPSPAPYSPPAPRRPESPVRESEHSSYMSEAASERQGSSYTPATSVVTDLDDDVDVPPFMRR